MTHRPAGAWTAALALLAVLLGGCAATNAGGEVTPPPSGTGFDYQLGGPYDPPSGASIVVRDRTAAPAGAGYDVCYVNGFQTQPDASEDFARDHGDLLIQVDGEPLIDPGWPDEFLFDTSTAQNRGQLAAIVGEWIDGCQEAGFDAVEIDNLDSFLRSDGATTAADNLALAEEYARLAHRAGLAIAQKNTPQFAEQLREAGYDFAVAESCRQFDECAAYTDVYPTVLDIEYTDEIGADGFADACQDADRPVSMILRDPQLVTPDDPAYRYETCPR